MAVYRMTFLTILISTSRSCLILATTGQSLVSAKSFFGALKKSITVKSAPAVNLSKATTSCICITAITICATTITGIADLTSSLIYICGKCKQRITIRKVGGKAIFFLLSNYFSFASPITKCYNKTKKIGGSY